MNANARPVCSVCIANYNGVALIDACILSVLAQDCDFAIEIIVHDDASTDGSVQAIRTRYPNVKVIESTENVGFCISNNRMVNAAQGDYILLLNNDAALFHDALRTLHETALRLKEAAILGLPQYDAGTEKLIDRGSRFDLFLNPVPNRDPARQDVGMVIGACLWLPRTLWNELGGFPDWFGSLAEDMLLCCLARLYGYRVIALPQSGFTHWVGKSLGGGKVTDNKLSTKATRRAASERNKNYVMTLVFPAPAFQLILSLHIILLLLEGCTLALIKRDIGILTSIYIASIKALWTRRAMLRVERKKIQARRRIGRQEFFLVFQWLPHKLELLFRHGIPKIQ
jgi:GT2 family glycosyltransferase